MPLPILHSPHFAEDDLLRAASQAQLEWSRHLGEELLLEMGRAIVCRQLPGLPYTNCVRDASADVDLFRCQTELDHAFGAAGVMCRQMAFHPAAAPTAAAVSSLIQHGYLATPLEVLHLRRLATVPTAGDALQIIPARAALPQLQALAAEHAAEAGLAEEAEATLLHLDDGHYDMLLGIVQRRPVGFVGVLGLGDVGTLQQLFVTPQFRGRGVGRRLLAAALDQCARALFRRVLAVLDPHARSGNGLLRSVGFEAVGQLQVFTRSQPAGRTVDEVGSSPAAPR